jgi:hypothetical protein
MFEIVHMSTCCGLWVPSMGLPVCVKEILITREFAWICINMYTTFGGRGDRPRPYLNGVFVLGLLDES